MDKAKSTRAKLLNIAKQQKVDFQNIVTRYLHERFLYRLSVSPNAAYMFLKGGNLVYALQGLKTRPTTDIDLLGWNLQNEVKTIYKIVSEIIAIQCEDSVWFNTDSLKTEVIAERNEYNGIRCLFEGGFDTIRQTIQLDIGFGDTIIPKPMQIEFPVLLTQSEVPVLMAYTPETVIAEKFQAMVSLGSINSRMKDIYDMYYLLNYGIINPAELEIAIQTTFQNRKTELDTTSVVFTNEYATDKRNQIMWKAFLKKIKAENDMPFEKAIEYIIEYLKKNKIL